MLFIFFLILFSLQDSYAIEESLNIKYDDLPRMLREKNQQILGQVLITESQKIKAGHLTRSFLPTAKADFGEEVFQTERLTTKTQPFVNLEAKINLYRGNRDLLEESLIKNQIQLSSLNQEEIFNKELIEARKVYWELVYTREIIQILNHAIEKNKKNERMSQQRVQRGLSPKVDLLEFEMKESELQEEISSFKHEEEILQIKLSGFFNLNPKIHFKTESSIPHIHDGDLLTREFNPNSYREVGTLEKQQESLQIQQSQTPRWWIPTVDVYSGYYLHNLREKDSLKISERDEVVAGLKVSFDLLDGHQAMTKSAFLNLQKEGLNLQTEQLKTKYNVQIEVLKEELKHEHELIHNMDHRIDKWNNVFNKILIEYNLGVKTSLDVLEASEKYFNLQKESVQRRKNYQMAKIHLLSYIGE